MRALTHPLVVLTIAAVLVGTLSWLLVGRQLRVANDALGIAPEDATMVVAIDLPTFFRSSLVRFATEEPHTARIVNGLRSLCGGEPLEEIQRVVVFAWGAEPSRSSRIGLVARGPIDRKKLTECATRALENEGSTAERTEIAGVPALSSNGGTSHAAFVGADALVFGTSADAVRKVVMVARGETEPASTRSIFAELWTSVDAGSAITAVSVLPDRWRNTLRRYLQGTQGASLVGLADASALGAGVRLQRGFGVAAAAAMPDASVAEAMREAVRKELEQALAFRVVSSGPLGPIVRNANVSTRGAVLVLETKVENNEADVFFERIVALFAPKPEETGATVPPRPNALAAPIEPNEVLER